ncbi:MAG: TetR/AcrR family transcriptional regulator [Deltaproteobacteria bacterium]|nr:TetR/AcrR family transcriptional regulator [Deltaproteobacteria bacterium]
MTGSGGFENEPRATSRVQQRLDTRERVFQAALAEFARVGVAQTQIERIVQLAGVSVGTFYRYFPGKDAVLLELEQRLVRDVVQAFNDRAGDARNLRELLHVFVESVLAAPDDVALDLQREAVALIVRTNWPVPDWWRHPLFGPLTSALARAQETGEINRELAPEKLMQILSTSVFGFSAGVVAPSAERVSDARLLVDLLLTALHPERSGGTRGE